MGETSVQHTSDNITCGLAGLELSMDSCIPNTKLGFLGCLGAFTQLECWAEVSDNYYSTCNELAVRNKQIGWLLTNISFLIFSC